MPTLELPRFLMPAMLWAGQGADHREAHAEVNLRAIVQPGAHDASRASLPLLAAAIIGLRDATIPVRRPGHGACLARPGALEGYFLHHTRGARVSTRVPVPPYGS
jgi:hypothetical protein